MWKGREGTSGWGWGWSSPSPGQGAYWVGFDGESSYIDCGSDPSLDNIPDGAAFTIDCWARVHVAPETDLAEMFVGKGEFPCGLHFAIEDWGGSSHLEGFVGALDAEAAIGAIALTPGFYNVWHHLLMCYDDLGDQLVHLAIDGAWGPDEVEQCIAGPYIGDAPWSVLVGKDMSAAAPHCLDGDVQWLRISSGIRNPVGVGFLVPDRTLAPAVDGDTIELWAMDEGEGAVTAASVLSPNNDGAMTACVWG